MTEAFPLDHLALRGAPADPALVTNGGTLSYAELDQRIGQLAALLQANVPEPGARVATWLPKTELACLMPLAAARAGLVHVPINAQLRRPQVVHILSDSGAKLLLTNAGLAKVLDGAELPECRIELADALNLDLAPLPPSKADPADLAAILYTSGSTGKPKGVVLSHANLWLGAESVAGYLGLARDERTLALLPLSFDYGQNQMLSTWHAGGAVYPLDFLLSRDVFRAIDKHKITNLAAVPPLLTLLTETEWKGEPLSSLRRLTNSGGALTRPLIAAAQDRLHPQAIFAMYGLTEAFRSTFLDPGLLAKHPDSMGTAIPHAEVLVLRPDGTTANPGEPGELVHAGPLVAQGYWNDPALTEQRFRPAPPQSRYGGKAVWSGDTVVERDGGLLYFVGRTDEMIKTSGMRVSPTEVEEAAMDSGLIAEAVAFGVPDARLGAAITLIARPLAAGDAISEALKAHFDRELPTYMRPARVIVLDEIPRTPNGKIDRNLLRQQFSEG